MKPVLLDVAGLSTTFPTGRGPLIALDDVSLSVDRGRTLGLVGESGSGKTVLARSIMGLLPAHAHRQGHVWFEGQDLAALSPRDLRDIWGREIAMVFQDPMTSLNPVMKVGRQITESLRHHLRMGKDEARTAAVDLLDSVGIPEPKRRADEYPHQLSGGMRQRVTIAIALACWPKLLLADEPTTALDVTVQSQILDLLQAKQAERSMAMILVTHDLAVVAGRTNEIAVMYAGRIVERADTATLFAETRMPYTESLLASIPRVERPSHTRLQAIAGRPPDLVTRPGGCRFAPRCRYAQPRCAEEEPPLLPAPTPGHTFACWYPVGTPAGDEALARNKAADRASNKATDRATDGR
ncbi:MAG: peptide/nickel transport system ATP-binding protein [Acidimicrobiaceae bacterium]|nr:peptide/nickel transport system ATP-binding protein [Acidimicrobiaceae bacterium]